MGGLFKVRLEKDGFVISLGGSKPKRTRAVKVRLGRKDHLIPYDLLGDKLIRITSHPLDKGKLLVWRQSREPISFGREERRAITVAEATRQRNRIREGESIASLAYYVGSGDAEVFHFEVLPAFQRKTLGTALRETMLRDLKGIEGIGEVVFPYHQEREFYLRRGFRALRQGGNWWGAKRFRGRARELGVKPAPVKLKVLWQRSRPRFA